MQLRWIIFFSCLAAWAWVCQAQTPTIMMVWNQQDLAACLMNAEAHQCVLKAPIKINPDAWRAQFPATYGAAVITPQRANLTITAGVGDDNGGGVVAVPHLQRLDWSGMAGLMALQPGAQLQISNLDMSNFSLKSDYTYSPATPYQSVGSGVSIWPTINGAPNTTFKGYNITGSYYNPSPSDDCPRYVEKTLAFLIQSFGAGNVSVVSATAVLLQGPLIITVPVKNGSTGANAGNATAIYEYVTVVCVERGDAPAAPGSISPGHLAAAIAAPLAAVLVAACGWLLWRCKRRRRTLHAAQGGPGKAGAQAKLLASKDIENGGFDDLQVVSDAATTRAPPAMTAPRNPGPPSAVLASSPPALLQPAAGNSDGAVPEHSATIPPACAPDTDAPHAATAHAGQTGSDASAPSTLNPKGSSSTAVASSGAWASVADSSVGTAAASTVLGSSSLSTVSRRGGSQTGALSAMLKARSDVAVLRDIKLGPLLGAGSYGRVFRGRWKATPVAVKIIDHYGSTDDVGSSRGNRVSAGREMLFATSISHPNLVTTFHISTLSSSQRAAAANPQLPADSPDNSTAGQQDARRMSSGSTNSSGSSSADNVDKAQHDLVQTWIVMEYCPKGSLEKTVKQGKLKLPNGQPDMVGIYKALLDTASGLDYLHSIGVVHGDLKTANVLLKGGKEQPGVSCKITDFGLSRVLDMNASHISTGTHGTIVYMPKELLLSGRMTQSTDIYSFGLMMWELFTSQRIMDSDEGLSIGQMFYMIAYQDWRPEVPPDCPPGYVELMTACWHEDPEQRPTAQQLLRRLQKLQGQARQGAVAARRAQAAADEDNSMLSTCMDSMGSESEASMAARQLHHLRMLAASREDAGALASHSVHSSPAETDQHLHDLDAMQLPQPGSSGAQPDGLSAEQALPTTQPAAAPAAPTSAAELAAALAPAGAWQQLRSDGHAQFLGDAAAAAVSLAPGCSQPPSSWAQEHPSTADASASSLEAAGLGVLGGTYAGMLPTAGDLSGAQLQHWQAETTVIHPVDLGFVNTYGEGFAGCLPAFCSSDEEGGAGLEAYVAALDAALAAEKAVGRLRLPN